MKVKNGLAHFVFVIGLLFVLLAGSYRPAYAATCTSASSGTLGGTNTATWSCGAPGAGDDFIIASGHTITLDGDFTALGITINSGGTFNDGAGSYTFTANSGYLTNNGTYTANTGTYEFNANNSNDGIYGSNVVAFNNVTVANGANVQFSGHTVSGILQVDSGGAVNTAPAYSVGSTLRINTGGSYGRSGEWGTVGDERPYNVQVSNNTTYDLANGDSSTAREARNDLTVDGNSTFTLGTLNAAFTVGGGATINGTLNLGGSNNADADFNGNVTIGTSGSFVLQSGTGDITVAGSWDNSAGGTFTHNGSWVTLDGVAQSVSGTTTFQRLITGGSGTKSFGASTVVIDERFTHGGGTMDGETSTFRFDGGGGTNLNGTNAKNFHNVIINASNVTHSAGNNFDVSGDFTVNDGASFLQTASGTKIVRFEGNGVQTITINGSGSASFRRMTVQSGAIVVLPDTGSTQPFVLASAITNNGAIRQTAASVSSSTNFVRICDDASCTTEQYIGMTINPTSGTPDLTVEIKGNTSVCNTNNGGVYRDRCYRVNASGAATVDITLYSTSGEDDITNDALYQYDGTGTSWTNRAACSDGVGAGGSCSASGISLASGDNYFLIGDSTNAPTAITLTTFTAQSAVHAPLAFLIGGAALLLVGGGMSALRRRIRR